MVIRMNSRIVESNRNRPTAWHQKSLLSAFFYVTLVSVFTFLNACATIEVAPLGQEIIPENEDKIIKDISDLLSGNLRKQYKDAQFLRDTHPKDNGCIRGTFTVDGNIDTPYQQGVFQVGASYPVWMRFSNSVETVKDDYEKDFRGLAMKLTEVNGERESLPGDEQHTQDFLFLGHDAFFAANPQQFLKFFEFVFSEQPERYVFTSLRGVVNILQGSKRYTNPLDVKWNSVTSYALGEQVDGRYEHVVRYLVKSCAVNSGEKPSEENPDYLAQNLGTQLENGTGCLDFYIQKQLDAEDMPVENALIAWDQEESPPIKVARINIPSQNLTSNTAQKNFCENISFNPWHSLTVHKPLGGINRARRTVMKNLSDLRLHENNQPRFEPTGHEVFE